MYTSICWYLRVLPVLHRPEVVDIGVKSYIEKHAIFLKDYDVASDVGVNFKNVGVLPIESSLFHLFHYTFLQTKHQRKGYLLYFTLMKNERQIKIQRKSYRLHVPYKLPIFCM